MKAKPATKSKKPLVKMRDLKPKKDAKGGATLAGVTLEARADRKL